MHILATALSGTTRPSNRVGGSPLIPLSDPRNAQRAGPEQIHLTGASVDSIHVTWSDNDTSTAPSVVEVRAVSDAASWTAVPGPSGSVYSALQAADACPGGYTDPSCIYTSSVLHSVQLTQLEPATEYEYRVRSAAGKVQERSSRSLRFTTPPARWLSCGSVWCREGRRPQNYDRHNVGRGLARRPVWRCRRPGADNQLERDGGRAAAGGGDMGRYGEIWGPGCSRWRGTRGGVNLPPRSRVSRARFAGG